MPAPPHREAELLAPLQSRPHVLTVALEDYFQVGAFNRFVQKNQWYRFETRLARNTERTLALLAASNARATVFVLGWIAHRFPELVRMVADAGHEVAIKGYYHRGVRGLTPEEFETDCLRAREAVEHAAGRKVVGYRLADGWFGPEDLWALDSLAKLGFGYDSSIAPMGRTFADQPYRRTLHEHIGPERTIWEVPISTAPILGVRLPVAGGNYLRQLPRVLTCRAAAKWVARESSPLVAYFHVWELDPEQPRLAIGGWFTHLRHYRNLDRMEARLTDLLGRYRFTSAAAYLDLSTRLDDGDRPPADSSWESSRQVVEAPTTVAGTPVSVVVPCFNEEDILPYMANALHMVRTTLGARGYDLHFILVDDGSTDRTWAGLNATFAGRPGFTLERHAANAGVQAAIMTGVRRAETEIVCSMDCDCTYDPLELGTMIPLLKPGVDLVTASPYHPRGQVRNVPAWRLGLSRGAAWLYRRILPTKLHTYTSCFRVYRRSSVANLRLANGRYLGVAELIGRVDLSGGTIVEHPATLEVRMLGRSKMKTLHTVLGHLGLMARMATARMLGLWGRAPRNQVIRSVLASHRENTALLIRQHDPASPGPEDSDVRREMLPRPVTAD